MATKMESYSGVMANFGPIDFNSLVETQALFNVWEFENLFWGHALTIISWLINSNNDQRLVGN